MWRVLQWIGNVVSVARGGSAIVDVGEGDPAMPPADVSAPRWVATLAVLTPLAVIVLAVLGVPWPILAIVAAILLAPLLLNRVRELRHR